MSVQGITSHLPDEAARVCAAPASRRKEGKGRAGGGTTMAIAVSIAIHAAIAAYVVTTQFVLTPAPVVETDPVLVEMVPIASKRQPKPPAPNKPETQTQVQTPPVAPEPVIQTRETPTPAAPVSAPLITAPAKTPQAEPVKSTAPSSSPAPSAPARNDFVGVDVDMALSNNPPPAYPPQAKARHEEGTVQLRLQVRADGSVGEVQLLSSSGSMRLDRAAMEAVRGWRFRPATRGGQAVESWATVPITFGFRRGDGRRGPDGHRGRRGGDRPPFAEQPTGDIQ